jgi:hypothetical protein
VSSFEILRILIKLYKSDELNYEEFCDCVDEFSSDPNEKYRLVRGLSKYTSNIEYYNFSDLKPLSDLEKSFLEGEIVNLCTEYMQDHGLSQDWDDSFD